MHLQPHDTTDATDAADAADAADARQALRRALAPRSIGVIGASDNVNKIGGRPIAYLTRFGYQIGRAHV